jgi:hypothetical protein
LSGIATPRRASRALSIVSNIVKNRGGSVHIRSDGEVGTVITVRLPAAPETDAAGPPLAA